MNILNFKLFDVDYTVNNSKNHWSGGLGIDKGIWEVETFKVFEYVKNKSKKTIDIGSWIGPTTIWLSENFQEVLSIEPDVIALEELRQNLKLSKCDNVWVLDKPILSEDIDVFFGPNQNLDWLNEQGLGESVSQARLSNEDSRDYKVEGICLSTLNKTIGNFFPFSEVSFVKVDIEGGEEFILEDVIKMAEEYKWSLWISFHIDWWKDKNLERFRNILNRSKKIKFNSIDFIEEDFDIIELLSSNPFASVYIEF